jgi:hypothetical protein
LRPETGNRKHPRPTQSKKRKANWDTMKGMRGMKLKPESGNEKLKLSGF